MPGAATGNPRVRRGGTATNGWTSSCRPTTSSSGITWPSTRPPEVVLAAACEQRMSGAAGRGSFKARELVLGSTPRQPAGSRGLVAETTALGWVVLREVPGREVIVGAVTKPWEADVTFRGIAPEHFAAFAEPGYVKIVWTLRAHPAGAGRSIFRTETRALATDAGARRKFRWYWALLSPGIIAIRWLAAANPQTTLATCSELRKTIQTGKPRARRPSELAGISTSSAVARFLLRSGPELRVIRTTAMTVAFVAVLACRVAAEDARSVVDEASRAMGVNGLIPSPSPAQPRTATSVRAAVFRSASPRPPSATSPARSISHTRPCTRPASRALRRSPVTRRRACSRRSVTAD